jgi:bacteriocin biosynthesis cyclodehydratase domain-containing protein
MDPLKYRRPIFVNPPFRDPLNAALARRLGDDGAGCVDRILPLLDGTHSIADIYGRLAADGLSPALVSGVLEVLDSLGSLSDTPPEEDDTPVRGEIAQYRDQIACFEEWLGVRQNAEEASQGAASAQAALGNARVVVMGLGRAGSALLEALSIAGVGSLLGIRAGGDSPLETRFAETLHDRIRALNPRTTYTEITALDGGDSASLDEAMASALLVYCPDTFHEAVCRELNGIALANGSSLLPYRETPFTVELGPLVVPGQTACYVCYELRRKAAEPKPGPDDEEPPPGTPALAFAAGVPLLALEIVKILTRTAFPVTRGKLWRLGLFDGSVGVHPVLKLPRCPACGVHRRTPPRRIWEE